MRDERVSERLASKREKKKMEEWNVRKEKENGRWK